MLEDSSIQEQLMKKSTENKGILNDILELLQFIEKVMKSYQISYTYNKTENY